MKKTTVLLFLCYLFLSSYAVKATHTDLAIVTAPFPVCSLPAPANLQYTMLASDTVRFTWDTVPGAAGYRSVLTDLRTGVQTITQGTNNAPVFFVIPGHDYNFTVAAMCSLDPPETSINRSELNFKPPAIIIEIIVKLTACPSGGSPLTDIDGQPYDNIFTYPWEVGTIYYIQLTKLLPSQNGGFETVKLKVGFIRDNSYHFTMGEFFNDGNAGDLCGEMNTPPYSCVPPPVSETSIVKFTYGGSTIHFAFPSVTGDLFYYTYPGELPFNEMKIYECGNGNPHGGRTDKPFDSINTASHDNILLQVAAVNPFSDQLTLYFTEFPEGPVRTRLFDLQGIPQIETVIRPGQLAENMYSLQTDALPAGMYFLQFEAPSGQVVTQKVLKI